MRKVKYKKYLGELCRKNHEYKNSGKSWRYGSGANPCIICVNLSVRTAVQNLRKKAIAVYSNGSNTCVNSGCKKKPFILLVLDHIAGAGGAETREAVGADLYRWLGRHNYPKTHPKYFPKGLRVLCNNCNQKDKKKRQPSPKTKKQKQRRQFHFKLLMDAVKAYSNDSNNCFNCGEIDFDVLCINHINGEGGATSRNEIGTGTAFFQWLRVHKYPKIDPKYFPDGLNVLCADCNYLERMRVFEKNRIKD